MTPIKASSLASDGSYGQNENRNARFMFRMWLNAEAAGITSMYSMSEFILPTFNDYV